MKTKILLKFIIFILLTIFIVSAWISYKDKITLTSIQDWLDSYGIWLPIIFIALYALATILLMSGAVLTMAGGVMFGVIWGTVYNLIGAVLGATVAFLIARYLAKDWVSNKIGGKLKILKEGAEQAEWRFIAVVRLVPILPFNLLNYALGLTKMHLLVYILGSAVFMLPGCLVYTYIGSLGEEVIRGELGQLATKILFAVGGIILLMCIPWIIKKLTSKP